MVRIDPSTNKVTATIKFGGSPKFMTAGEGAVWVQNRTDGSVSRIDPRKNIIQARPALTDYDAESVRYGWVIIASASCGGLTPQNFRQGRQ